MNRLSVRGKSEENKGRGEGHFASRFIFALFPRCGACSQAMGNLGKYPMSKYPWIFSGFLLPSVLSKFFWA